MTRQFVDTYQGRDIFFEHISYNCPSLKLYGYSSEVSIKSAIRKKLKKHSILKDYSQ